MIAMPPNASTMPSRRRQRMVSPSSHTDSSVENGTPIWLAIATIDASFTRYTPTNNSANAAGPVNAAASNRFRI